MATGGDDRTLDFYTREAPVYAGFAAEAEDSRFLTAFTDMLPAGATVMDFGCGPAWAANRFREMGFDAHGFDGSAGLTTKTKKLYNIKITISPFKTFNAINTFHRI